MKTILKYLTMLFVFASVIAVTSCKETEEEILPVAVSSVSVDSDSLSLKVGEEHTLVATILPENADSKAVTWSSDNTEVATVDAGVVTAVSAGTATITVTTTDGGKTTVCEITVSNENEVSSVSVEPESLSLKVGEEYTLVATVLPEDADDPSVTWSSDNTEVATVDESTGVVTAVSAGVANITVTTIDGEKTAVCEITVSADERENGEDD